MGQNKQFQILEELVNVKIHVQEIPSLMNIWLNLTGALGVTCAGYGVILYRSLLNYRMSKKTKMERKKKQRRKKN